MPHRHPIPTVFIQAGLQFMPASLLLFVQRLKWAIPLWKPGRKPKQQLAPGCLPLAPSWVRGNRGGANPSHLSVTHPHIPVAQACSHFSFPDPAWLLSGEKGTSSCQS